MAIKSKPIYVCDNCGKELAKPVIYTEGVANEGCSEIHHGQRVFYVDNSHYCGFECLVKDLQKKLGI